MKLIYIQNTEQNRWKSCYLLPLPFAFAWFYVLCVLDSHFAEYVFLLLSVKTLMLLQCNRSTNMEEASLFLYLYIALPSIIISLVRSLWWRIMFPVTLVTRMRHVLPLFHTHKFHKRIWLDIAHQYYQFTLDKIDISHVWNMTINHQTFCALVLDIYWIVLNTLWMNLWKALRSLPSEDFLQYKLHN